MEKNEFTEQMRVWLEAMLKTKLSDSYATLEVITPTAVLSKLANEYLKSMPNYSSWDFRPDVVAIVLNKKTNEKQLILLNRSLSALSLKEIGEISCYARLTNAPMAFLASTRGLSSEVNILLLDDAIRNRVLKLRSGEDIIIFAWNEKSGAINPNSIIPLHAKDFLIG